MSWAQDTKFRLQVVLLMAMFGCPAYIVWMGKETKLQIASTSWPSVKGEIQGIVAKRWYDKKSKSTQYYGRPKYRYAVQGKEYTSERINLGPTKKRASSEAALADVGRYTPEMTMPVYYDPQDPRVGILERGIPPIHLRLLIGLSFVTVVSVIFWFYTIRGWFIGKKQVEPIPE